MSLATLPRNPALEQACGFEAIHYKDAVAWGLMCRLAAFEEAALLLEKIEAGYGVTDRGLSDEEYERMKQTAREHQVAIRRLK